MLNLLTIITNKKNLFFYLILFLAVAICYYNSFQVPFIWDDEVMIVQNDLIKSLNNIPSIFLSSPFGEIAGKNSFYRPIQTLTYTFDYALWGMNPIGFHFTSTLIHFINALLLFWFLGIITKTNSLYPAYLPLLGALLFTVHPLNVEAVTYLSGRGDLLCFFFSMLCLISFILGNKKKSLLIYLLSHLFYILSILSKENAVIIPLLLTGYFFILNGESKKKQSHISLILLNLVMIFYIIFRFLSINDSSRQALSLIAESSLWERCITLPHILATYLRLFFIPYNLHMEYHFVIKDIVNLKFLLDIFILGGLLYLLFRILKNNKIVFLWVGWFLTSLLPVLHIPVPLASTLREHWLLIPSVGLIVIFVLFFEKALTYFFNKKILKKSYIIFYSIVLIVLGGVTILRNQDWQEPLSLYLHDVRLEPNSFLLHNNIGVIYFRNKNYSEAKKFFIRAIEVAPGNGYSMAFNNLGVISQRWEKDLEKAKYYYRKSIDLAQDYQAYQNLITILIREKKIIETKKLSEEALKKYPYDVPLKQFYMKLSQYKNKD